MRKTKFENQKSHKHLFYIFLLGATTSHAMDVSRSDDPPSPNSVLAAEKVNVLAPEVFIIAFPSQPLDIPKPGEGFDLVKGVRRPASCVKHGGLVETYVGSSTSSLSQVTDDEMLWRKLNTSIEAKAKYGGWSGGGSYSETIETRVSTSHVNVVARANFITKAINLSPSSDALKVGLLPDTRLDLTSQAYNLLSSGKLTDFRNSCGDGYIAQVALGAYFISTLDFNSREFESKKEIIAALNVSGPADVFSASGQTKIQEEMKSKKEQLKIDASQYGGNVQLNPTTQSELVEAYHKLPERAQTNPSILYLTVVRYDSLPSVQSTNLVVSPYWIYADQALRQLMRLQTVRNDIARAIAEFTDQPGEDPTKNTSDFVHLPSIETGIRSLDGFKETLKSLQVSTATLGKWLAKCMSITTEKNCTPNQNDRLDKYDDLLWRARAPLAKADIAPDLLADITQRANSPDAVSRKEAACYLALTIRANAIRQISALRQKYDNFANEEATHAAEIEVMRSLSLSDNDCAPLFPKASGFKIKKPIQGVEKSLLK